MAMSYGLPVIVSRLRGFEETIKHEKNGLLVEPSDEAQLSEAIDRLLSDQTLRESLSKEALKTIRVHHDWKKIAVQFKALFS